MEPLPQMAPLPEPSVQCADEKEVDMLKDLVRADELEEDIIERLCKAACDCTKPPAEIPSFAIPHYRNCEITRSRTLERKMKKPHEKSLCALEMMTLRCQLANTAASSKPAATHEEGGGSMADDASSGPSSIPALANCLPASVVPLPPAATVVASYGHAAHTRKNAVIPLSVVVSNLIKKGRGRRVATLRPWLTSAANCGVRAFICQVELVSVESGPTAISCRWVLW
ncbi:hypothetical protein B0H13DRAFT_2361788 [Mycena leptocephala]|nr:hypothetical protein B0H13DRAFT_2361788 [Mycena leptocephala]